MTTLTDARKTGSDAWVRSFEDEGTYILDVDHDTTTVTVAYNFPLEPDFAADWVAEKGRQTENELWEEFHNYFDPADDEDLLAALTGAYVIDIVRVGRTEVKRLN